MIKKVSLAVIYVFLFLVNLPYHNLPLQRDREVCNGTLKGETEPCKLKRPDFEKYNVPLVKEYTGPTTDWDSWR